MDPVHPFDAQILIFKFKILKFKNQNHNFVFEVAAIFWSLTSCVIMQKRYKPLFQARS